MFSSKRLRVEITDEHGLHLRAANQLVQIAKRFQSDIRVFWNDRVADGKSILELMTLGAQCGVLLEFEVIGPDSEEAAAAITELVESRRDDHENGQGHACET